MVENTLKGEEGRNETEVTFILLPIISEALGKADRRTFSTVPGQGSVTRKHTTLAVSNSHLQNQSFLGEKTTNKQHPQLQ